MDGKVFAPLGAIVFIAVALTATAIEMTRKEEAAVDRGVDRARAETADPLQAELVRCASIGEAGPRDPACLRAWADNRRRFLTPAPHPARRRPEAPQASHPTATITAPAIPLQPEEAR